MSQTEIEREKKTKALVLSYTYSKVTERIQPSHASWMPFSLLLWQILSLVRCISQKAWSSTQWLWQMTSWKCHVLDTTCREWVVSMQVCGNLSKNLRSFIICTLEVVDGWQKTEKHVYLNLFNNNLKRWCYMLRPISRITKWLINVSIHKKIKPSSYSYCSLCIRASKSVWALAKWHLVDQSVHFWWSKISWHIL